MDAIKCLKTRRSIRKYTAETVTDKQINEILECARNAPSAHNCQSWEFIVVKDEKKKTQLSQVHQWAGFVKDAPVVIVTCHNKNRDTFTPPSTNRFTPAVAVENILLAAHALGLGACWVYVKDDKEPNIEENVKKILDLPENLEVICQVPIGHPNEKPHIKKLIPKNETIRIQ